MRRLLVLGIVLFGVVLTVATPAQAAARIAFCARATALVAQQNT